MNLNLVVLLQVLMSFYDFLIIFLAMLVVFESCWYMNCSISIPVYKFKSTLWHAAFCFVLFCFFYNGCHQLYRGLDELVDSLLLLFVGQPLTIVAN